MWWCATGVQGLTTLVSNVNYIFVCEERWVESVVDKVKRLSLRVNRPCRVVVRLVQLEPEFVAAVGAVRHTGAYYTRPCFS